MATFASLSSLPFSSRSSLHSSSPQSRLPYLQNHFNVTLLQLQTRATKLLLFPPKCSTRETKSEEPDTTSLSSSSLSPASSSSSSSSSSISPSSPSDMSYKLFFGLGGIGLLETSYLTFLKLTNSTAFCPVGAGSCSDVLSSDYAVVFGVPLPLIGMIAYGLVVTLGAQLSKKSFSFGMVENDGRKILLWTITSMAAASAYFLYVLTTKFAGTSCSYCLLSALLSFTLLFIAVKDFGLEEIQKEVGLQLCIAGLVVVSLNSAYSGYRPVPPSLDDIDLPYFATGITTASSPYALSLAKHLNAIGAKMYGAFWCSHCLEQKEMFGREAAKLLNYKECFPNGFKKGTKMETECSEAGLEGFPTWVINGKVMSGIFELSDLAEASGFIPETVVQSPEVVD